MTLPPLLIRADASTEIGTGHVMRCLALAQAWQDKGGGVTYCCATLPQTLHTRLVTEQITVRRLDAMAGSANDAESVIALAREIGAEAVVVDGYVFGSEYQKLIKNAGLRLLFIDDYGHAEHYYADFVLNQNAHADTITYVNRESNTQLLLGTRYALLRREFWPWRGRKRPTVPQANKLLVTMGGSDPDNITMRLLDKLTSILDDKAVHIKTVVGGSNPHLDSLLLRANREHGRIDILQNVHDMPALMACADMAISAGGTTLWELALLGVPTCAIVIAENQLGSVEAFSDGGAIETLSLSEDVALFIEELRTNPARRAALSNRSQHAVDGYGVERVIDSMLRGSTL